MNLPAKTSVLHAFCDDAMVGLTPTDISHSRRTDPRRDAEARIKETRITLPERAVGTLPEQPLPCLTHPTGKECVTQLQYICRQSAELEAGMT